MKAIGMMITSGALALCLAGGALAQGAPAGAAAGGAPAQGAAGAAGGAAPAMEDPLTPADVDPARPFGELDIAAAGNTVETVQAWAAQLTDDQKSDITNRCRVIETNADNYQEPVRTFCQNWIRAIEMTGDPAAPGGPGTPIATPPAPAR